jgi:lipopolysaccharide/colanic/teichoic acid biosynthesis glycosyltransferase
MSLVGPRPEVPSFVERFRRDYEEILTVRPGITDPASIRYRSEARILGAAANPVDYYTQVILPDKIQISRVYLRSASFGRDVSLICQTIAALFQK